MNFVNLSELYWMVSPEAPGLNEDVAIKHLREAARDFCSYTLASQETVELSIAVGDADLQVQPSSSYVVLKSVIRIDSPRGEIKPTTLGELARRPNWRASTGAVTHYVEEGGAGELRLYPITTEAEDLHVRIAVMPSRGALKVDKVIVDRWGDAIASGALSRILRMSGQSWTNPVEATRKEADFTHYKSRARVMAHKDNGFTTTRAAIRRMF